MNCKAMVYLTSFQKYRSWTSVVDESKDYVQPCKHNHENNLEIHFWKL